MPKLEAESLFLPETANFDASAFERINVQRLRVLGFSVSNEDCKYDAMIINDYENESNVARRRLRKSINKNMCNNVFIRMITRSFNDFIIELKLIESKTIFMESKIF